MNRLKRILVVTAVVPLVCFGLFGPTPGGAYDSAGINMQMYTVGKDAVEPVYLLGEENIPLLLVIRNETGKPVVTERGFSEVELDDALVVKDPNGIGHLLREVGDAHFMRTLYFLNDKPWAKAESLPPDWVRSVEIEDLREKLPVMKTLAGWYTIRVQQPFVRYAATGQDAGLGFLGLLDHPNNWSGTLQSNTLQIYVAPSRGAKIDVTVSELVNEVAQPLGQVPVRVFRNTDIPGDYSPADVWSKTEPVLSGTSDFDGNAVWESPLACVNRDNYTVLANYAGKYLETGIPADSKEWNVECTGLVSAGIAYSESPAPQSITITGNAYNYPDNRYRATFSINVSTADGNPSGDFRYYFIRTRMNFVSTSINEVTAAGKAAIIKGDGTVNGKAGYSFESQVVDDDPDQFGIQIRKTDGGIYYDASLKSISGGNIGLTVE
jgi:hypothetical protein